MRTPNTTRVFTQDFADSPIRVAYVLEFRAYVVIEVETGNVLDWHERYQAAYEHAAKLNTEIAAEETVHCEACGQPVDPADAVLDGEEMVCAGCAEETAELALAQRAQVADSAMALEDERAETVIISCPGLTWNAIRVTAQSTVNHSTEGVGSYQYEGITVDGVFVALVRTAHVMSNEALLRAEIDGVMRDLVDAIRRLNPDWPQLESEQLARLANEAADGDEPPAAGVAIPVPPRQPDNDDALAHADARDAEDAALIAAAGGPGTNPYRAERHFDECRVIERATGRIVWSGDYGVGVPPSAREWWLRKLRAATLSPAPHRVVPVVRGWEVRNADNATVARLEYELWDTAGKNRALRDAYEDAAQRDDRAAVAEGRTWAARAVNWGS